MKRLITLLLASVMLMSMALTSCSGGDNDDGGDSDSVRGDGSDTVTDASDTDAPDTDALDTEAPAANFEGTLSEILASIVEKSGNEEIMTMEEAVTGDNADYTIGLTADQLEQYVDDALLSMAMLNVHAHLISVIKAKDAEAAKTVKELLAENFDNRRWVCVMPDKSAVVEAGEYVLLAVSNSDYVDNMTKAFTELAGEAAGEVNVFFEGEELEW